MKLLIDTDSRVLTTENAGARREIPLYSREAFERRVTGIDKHMSDDTRGTECDSAADLTDTWLWRMP
jgi:hypothetical protein